MLGRMIILTGEWEFWRRKVRTKLLSLSLFISSLILPVCGFVSAQSLFVFTERGENETTNIKQRGWTATKLPRSASEIEKENEGNRMCSEQMEFWTRLVTSIFYFGNRRSFKPKRSVLETDERNERWQLGNSFVRRSSFFLSSSEKQWSVPNISVRSNFSREMLLL